MLTAIVSIVFLAIMEGLLSFDNALALAAMVKGLPAAEQKRALTYGIVGAFVFRILAIVFAIHIIENPYMRLVGGAYLVWLAWKNLYGKKAEASVGSVAVSSFWKTVLLVELTDIVFSIDSILAAVAFSKETWVVVLGGVIGIVLMRFSSTVFIKLMKRFPELETSAFLLVGIVGVKLLLETQTVVKLDFHSPAKIEFWTFWAAMLVGLGLGFTKQAEVKL